MLSITDCYNRIGASIVVLTKFSRSPVFDQQVYNPQCFLLHEDLLYPFSDVSNVSMLAI